ncbi:MAG TPA: LacI family DNA-binding transcriptional regulator, partial [Abditibacteriaceae bacterium]
MNVMSIKPEPALPSKAVKNTGSRTVTIKDVARQAGVTPATVSFTLSGKRNASPKTKEAILRAARELGYVPNPHAQRLANGGCDKTIALLWVIDLGISTEQANFIAHRLDEAGFLCDWHVTPTYVSDSAHQQAEVVGMLCRQEPRAIICRSHQLEEPALLQLQRYAQDGGAVVCYGTKGNESFDNVVFNRGDNMYRAARHLVDLGHRKIGLSIHGEVVPPDDPGVIGFRRALAESQVEIREDWIWAHSPYEKAGSELAERFLQLKDRPTALCIINDVTASTFVTQIYRHGLRVPQDVSVVGYDDAPAASYALVPLTTISHPIAGIAQPLLEMLFSRIDGTYDGPARCVEVKGELIVRESTAAPAVPSKAQPRRKSSASAS